MIGNQREAGQEQHVTREGRRPDGSVEDDERLEDADAIDDVESRHELAGGRV